MKFYTVVFSLFVSFWLSGCAVSIDQKKYADVSPGFDMESFFSGNVKAWGIVQNRSGDVVQRFTVNIDGRIENDILILDETFDYEVGEGPATRVWQIEKTGQGLYKGSATDIPGPATGTIVGNSLRWQYQMTLPVDDTNYDVIFDDWMWMFNDNTLINRSYIKKFGITFAEVTIFMQKT